MALITTEQRVFFVLKYVHTQKIGNLQATIDQLTQAKFDLERQFREAETELKATVKSRLSKGLKRELVSTARKKTLGYKLCRRIGETSQKLRGELQILRTTLNKTFKDGIGKVFDIRILNSVDSQVIYTSC